MSEWDPWRRYEKERESRYWDPWYRVEYERDRLSWDPHFRTEKEIERKYSDPEFRWRLYEEKRNSSDWLELYHENPMDPMLRRRYDDPFDGVSSGISYFSSTGIGSGKDMDENMERAWRLMRAISLYNQLYSRDWKFWLNLILKLGFIGFMIWWLLSLKFP